ncbi:hypothetical protein [Actinoplanes derwentensis]|uniref:Uncharacterized protein n=1 Tax=Actinoplanes derwentensis TaxID=113562 RepID=A0A1H1ZXI9_9ACTN|nr:hypothetical protein [Actinoplanes derwentensis]GID83505.1 hypothetical protein Ade03nite_24290 [Actinoplanes derwentensis]SDT38112.1 hypothetical protein SAMN04489716_3537 [Actinoplanes derwentensis]
MSKNTVKRPLTHQRRTRGSRLRLPVMVALLVWFLSGRPLDGRRHSDCTFWTAGTRRVGRPSYLITFRWWALAAGWQRLGLRLTAVAVLSMAVVGVVAR